MEKVVQILDQRFYPHNGEFYPSVTTVLGVISKGHHFNEWLMQYGAESRVIANIAKAQGSNVHNAVELMDDGVKLCYNDFDEKEWRCLRAAHNFYKDFDLKLTARESKVISEKHKYAGTLDGRGTVTVKGEKIKILLDWKTSKYTYEEYKYQLSAYEKGEIEMGKEASDELWIVRLGSSTKRGYSLTKVKKEDVDRHFETFLTAQKLWRMINPNAKCNHKEIPFTLSLKEEEEINNLTE